MAAKKKTASAGGARRAKATKHKKKAKRSTPKPAARNLHDSERAQAAERKDERCAVVGLGPAVSGRSAFRRALEAAPGDDGMAYVFVPRLEAYQERLIEDLLSSLKKADARQLAGAAKVYETLRRRERQQAAIADLGQSALAGAELQALFDEAVHRVSEALETEFCKVLKLLPDGREVRLVAGVGWQAGLVGTATVGTGLDSQAGYTLQRASPVIVEDLQTDKRFNGPPLLTDHGVVSGMSVVIGPPADPWGVLGTHTRQHARFTVDDANFLQSVANVLWDAIARQRAEAALRESEHRRRLVKDALPVLIAYCDADVVYRFCNAAYEEWFGLKRDEVVGRRLVDVIGAEAFAKVEPYVRRVLKGEQVAVEQQLPYKHGPSRHVRVTYVPHRDESHAVVGYYAMIEDISDRKRFEQQLLDTNNRLAAIVDTAADGIVIVDAAGTIESANRVVGSMFGYTSDELLGQNVDMLLSEPYRGTHGSHLSRRDGDGQSRILEVGREILGRRKDGTDFPLDVAVSEFTLGKERRFTWILRDISEAKRVEEVLLQQEAQLRLITDSVPALIAYVDADRRHRFVNAAFEEWYGRPRGEIEGLTVRELLGDESYAQFQPRIEKVLCGEPQMFEYDAERPGGARQMHSHYIPHHADDDCVLGYIVVMTDVTERNHAVAERAMLEASERERRRIGQDLHDSLGQELTGLSLMAQNVADELRDTAHPIVQTADDLARGLRGALQRVRRMSRGLVPIDEVDRRGLIVALENLATQTRETGGVDCTIEALDPVDVPGGETATHLYRIAQEAVANAAKHAGAKRVTLSLRQRGSEIVLSIRDDGRGFERDRNESAGMGLRVMRYRTDRIGGSLTISSRSGRGTKVVCTLISSEK